MSKGDSPRPIPDPQKFRDNWDAIFGKKSDEKSSACPKCGDEGYSVKAIHQQLIAFVTTANMNLMAKLQRIENENVWLFGE